MDAPNGPTLTSAQVIWSQEAKIVSFTGSGEPGGRITFSPDGQYLYIAAGDRQEFLPVQSLDNTLGKIIRIFPDGTIPTDNPFVGIPGALPEIWTLGHRNPYGLLFTPDGNLWQSEMGPRGGDELNVLVGAANYGWPLVSYGNNYDGGLIPKPSPGDGFAPSAYQWTPVIAPAGMIYYSGTTFPDWQGDLILSGLQSKGLVIVDINGTTAVEQARVDLGIRTRDVVQGPDGSLWVLYDQPDGRLVQLTPHTPITPAAPEAPVAIVRAPLQDHGLASATLSNGQTVSTWNEQNGTGGSSLKAQLYNADGIPIGQEIILSQTTGGNQGAASVSAVANGGFAITYGTRTGDVFNVYARLVDANGVATGSPILVNTTAASLHAPPSITVLADGSFAVSWLGTNAQSNTDVRVQLFSSGGTKIGGEIVASDHPEVGKIGEHITALTGGGFAVSWTTSGEAGAFGTDTGVRARLFDLLGNPVGNIISVNTATAGNQGNSALAATPSGGLVVTWSDDGHAYGGYVNGTSTGTQGIWAQLLDASGSKVGSAVRVSDDGKFGFAPSVSVLPGIGFAVVWQDLPAVAGASKTILTRLFDFSGQPLGPEFAVSPNSEATQSFPTAAGAAGGSLFVGWTNADGATPTQLHELAASFHIGVGSPQNDISTGTAGADIQFGGLGSDTINGGAGADVLIGGAGADILTGGTGSDRFVDTIAGHNGDTITDFDRDDTLIFSDANLASFAFTITGNTLSYSGGSLVFSQALGGHLRAAEAAGGGVALRFGPAVTDDFNGDGRSDILWRNVDGTFGTWLGQANGALANNSSAGLIPVPVDWHIVATADFNGDGRNDILWRNDSGVFGDWLGTASGSFTDNGAAGLTPVSNDWHIVATGDFNGDFRDDILWRNDDGRFGDWLGTASGAFVDNSAAGLIAVSRDWHIAATGDFNGDGRDDILWRNDSGAFGDWLGQADGSFAYNAAAGLTPVPIEWHIAATGDFNGDGRDDILWRNNDGSFGDWLGQPNGGFAFNSAAGVSSVPIAWHISGTGDYNGDGRDDILWRNDDGTFGDWLGQPNGSFLTNNVAGLTNVSTSWHLQPDPLII